MAIASLFFLWPFAFHVLATHPPDYTPVQHPAPRALQLSVIDTRVDRAWAHDAVQWPSYIVIEKHQEYEVREFTNLTFITAWDDAGDISNMFSSFSEYARGDNLDGRQIHGHTFLALKQYSFNGELLTFDNILAFYVETPPEPLLMADMELIEIPKWKVYVRSYRGRSEIRFKRNFDVLLNATGAISTIDRSFALHAGFNHPMKSDNEVWMIDYH